MMWQHNKELANGYYAGVKMFAKTNPNVMIKKYPKIESLIPNYDVFEDFMTYVFYKYERCPESKSTWLLNAIYAMSGYDYDDEIHNDYGRAIAYGLWYDYRKKSSKATYEIYALISALCEVILDNWGYENKL